MNDSVDWSCGNDFIGNLLRTAKAIELSTTKPVPIQIVAPNNLWGKIQSLISDEQKPMKVTIEEYDG